MRKTAYLAKGKHLNCVTTSPKGLGKSLPGVFNKHVYSRLLHSINLSAALQSV